MNREQIAELIEGYQQIQKTNPPTSPSWIRASSELRHLFGLMVELDKCTS